MSQIGATLQGGSMNIDAEATLTKLLADYNGKVDHKNIKYFSIDGNNSLSFTFEGSGELILNNAGASGIIRTGFGQVFQTPNSDGTKRVQMNHDGTNGRLDVNTGAMEIETNSEVKLMISGNTEFLVDANGPQSATMPRCHVYDSSNPTVNNTTVTKITFDTAVYNVGGMWSSGTNPDRITFPSAGQYLIFVHVRWPSNPNGFRFFRLDTAAVTGIRDATMNAISGDKTYMSQTFILDVAANDYILWQLYQNSGANLTPDNGANITYVVVQKILGAD